MSFICADSRGNAKRGGSCPYWLTALFRGFFSIISQEKQLETRQNIIGSDNLQHYRYLSEHFQECLHYFFKLSPGVYNTGIISAFSN
jgi:hypothetical protein